MDVLGKRFNQEYKFGQERQISILVVKWKLAWIRIYKVWMRQPRLWLSLSYGLKMYTVRGMPRLILTEKSRSRTCWAWFSQGFHSIVFLSTLASPLSLCLNSVFMLVSLVVTVCCWKQQELHASHAYPVGEWEKSIFAHNHLKGLNFALTKSLWNNAQSQGKAVYCLACTWFPAHPQN